MIWNVSANIAQNIVWYVSDSLVSLKDVLAFCLLCLSYSWIYHQFEMSHCLSAVDFRHHYRYMFVLSQLEMNLLSHNLFFHSLSYYVCYVSATIIQLWILIHAVSSQWEMVFAISFMTMIAMSRLLLEKKVIRAVSCQVLRLVCPRFYYNGDSCCLMSQFWDHVCCVWATIMMEIYCILF